MERAAAGTFTGIGLELGGKDPGYVMEDADLEAAVATLIDGAGARHPPAAPTALTARYVKYTAPG